MPICSILDPRFKAANLYLHPCKALTYHLTSAYGLSIFIERTVVSTSLVWCPALCYVQGNLGLACGLVALALFIPDSEALLKSSHLPDSFHTEALS